MNYSAFIDECDKLIAQGQISDARARLADLKVARIPSTWILSIAKLCRRAGVFNLGLKIMAPTLQGRPLTRPSDSELCEYGALLLKVGATKEAFQLLSEASQGDAPEYHLYTAFCYFHIWDYHRAIPHLEKYLTLEGVTAYQKYVAQVNLAASLNAVDRFSDAIALLSDIKKALAEKGHSRLLGNCHELTGIAHFYLGDWATARNELEEAKKILSDAFGMDSLFIEKWYAAIEAAQTGQTEQLHFVRKKAKSKHEYEILRDCDKLLLRYQFDPKRFAFLYFGTPFSAYRQNLEREFNVDHLPEHFDRGRSARCLDLATGTLSPEAKTPLNPGKGAHRLISVLFKDFYRPICVGELHQELFPGEHFNPYSSPIRVRVTINRAREWLQNEKLPLAIKATKNGYEIGIQGEIRVRISRDSQVKSAFDMTYARLRLVTGSDESFSAVEAREALGMPKSTFRTFLQQALEKGHVEALGTGKRSRYRHKAA